MFFCRMFDIQVFQWHVSRGFIVKNPILWFLSSPSGFIVIEWKKWVYLRIITESLLQHHCIKQLDLDLISSYWTNRGLNLGQYLVIFDTTMLLFLLLDLIGCFHIIFNDNDGFHLLHTWICHPGNYHLHRIPGHGTIFANI